MTIYHYANLRTPEDLDDDLRQLLVESYDFTD
jgi:hypothetical protein